MIFGRGVPARRPDRGFLALGNQDHSTAARIRSRGTSGDQENGHGKDEPENSFQSGENSDGPASSMQYSRLCAPPVSSEIHFAGV